VDVRWRSGRALRTAAVNVINTLELDAVVLTGDVVYRGEILRASVERFIAENMINRRLMHLPVYLSTLGELPELMAASGIGAEKFFQGQVKPELLGNPHVKRYSKAGKE